MKKIFAAILTALAVLITGCSTTYESQVQETHVVVTPSTSNDLYLIVSKPLSDTDDTYDPSQGIVLPLGKYSIEAEDIDYWYFRAPKPIVLALYDFGRQTNGMRLPGGVAISKTGDNSMPKPCFYTDDSGKNGKILIWLTTPEFMKARGDKWRLSTDEQKSSPSETLDNKDSAK